MAKKRFIEKGNKMCLKVREKNKDGKVVSKVVPASNFIFSPIIQVGGQRDGYIMRVSTFPCGNESTELTAYCSSNPKRDDFIFALNKALHSKGGGGLTCSLPDVIFRNQFVKKVLEFQTSDAFVYKKATKVLGRVPDVKELVWVLSNKMQIDHLGEAVKTPQYLYIPDDLDFTLELTDSFNNRPLRDSFKLLKSTLKHNYPAALYTLGALSVVIHAQLIEEKFDGCPAVVLVGEPGRGKTTALKLALSSIGMLNCGLLKSFSKEKILSRASKTTMGVYVDDPPNMRTLKELIVDFFNRASTGTLSRGVEPIRCGMMITSNDVLSGTPRELRRIVYIPFLGDSVAGKTPDEIKSYVLLKDRINSVALSGAIGAVIRTGIDFYNGGWEEVLDYTGTTKTHMPSALSDVQLPYALLLWFTVKLCKEILRDPEELRCAIDDLEEYFEDKMAPFVDEHQRASREPLESTLYQNEAEDKKTILVEFREKLNVFLASVETNEVNKFVRRRKWKGRQCLALRSTAFDAIKMKPEHIVSHLVKADIGGSQSRRLDGASSPSERCVFIDLQWFETASVDGEHNREQQNDENGHDDESVENDERDGHIATEDYANLNIEERDEDADKKMENTGKDSHSATERDDVYLFKDDVENGDEDCERNKGRPSEVAAKRFFKRKALKNNLQKKKKKKKAC